jgi:D-beta-D-heptose 7-phosphate kinase/D-beta-D-heptose 1-phosphate adenosyltransferase
MLQIWKGSNNTIVFTNGCFDIIHHGHVDSLQKSAALGTKLIVGLNSDESVNRLKGANRPVLNQQARAQLLAAFECVDAVIIFEEDTPAEIIALIIPDVLVKGAQYEIHEIAGHDTVLENGGIVEKLELVDGISTSDLIDRIKKL